MRAALVTIFSAWPEALGFGFRSHDVDTVMSKIATFREESALLTFVRQFRGEDGGSEAEGAIK